MVAISLHRLWLISNTTKGPTTSEFLQPFRTSAKFFQSAFFAILYQAFRDALHSPCLAAASRIALRLTIRMTNLRNMRSYCQLDISILPSKFGVNGSSGVKKRRTELAGGEGVEGAEAGGEFGGGQAALAVEAAEKIVGRLFSFLGVAFHATGDQVAVGIAPQPRLRHDVVQALDRRGGPAQTVEALAALARVDGLSQRLAVQKVRFLEIHRRAGARAFFLGGGPAFDTIQPHGANLAGQPHLDHVPQFAALDHAQGTVRDEAADRLTHGSRG